MASGLNTTLRIVKAIDRAHRQYVREAERQRKSAERETVRQQRENERLLRQEEREEATRERTKTAIEKSRFKQNLEGAAIAFQIRCQERKTLRESIINEVFK